AARPTVQPAPPAPAKRERVRTTQSAKPKPDFDSFPIPVEPEEEPSKPSLRGCFPFGCDDSPPEEDDEGEDR
ncbi:MAG: hypothetical protein M3143_03590, partial [Actinomycetota bacterium]|nr:hypothetical protein [Actinomycetota bacterium]